MACCCQGFAARTVVKPAEEAKLDKRSVAGLLSAVINIAPSLRHSIGCSSPSIFTTCLATLLLPVPGGICTKVKVWSLRRKHLLSACHSVAHRPRFVKSALTLVDLFAILARCSLEVWLQPRDSRLLLQISKLFGYGRMKACSKVFSCLGPPFRTPR